MNIEIDGGEAAYRKALDAIDGLEELVAEHLNSAKDKYFFMELLVNGLAVFGLINKEYQESSVSFNDSLAGMFDDDSIFKL